MGKEPWKNAYHNAAKWSRQLSKGDGAQSDRIGMTRRSSGPSIPIGQGRAAIPPKKQAANKVMGGIEKLRIPVGAAPNSRAGSMVANFATLFDSGDNVDKIKITRMKTLDLDEARHLKGDINSRNRQPVGRRITMSSKRQKLRVGLVVLLSLFLWQPAIAGIPVSIGGDGQTIPTLAPLLERVTPGVVNIAVRGHVAAQSNPLLEDPFFRRFFGVPEQQQPQQREFQAAGSGVIVDAEKGYIITNNHVVEHADEITVTLRDGRRLKAKRVGTDPETDVAVVKVEPGNLTAVPLGDSDKLKVGDFVIAVGNPFGLGQTVTSGIVSALGRSGLGIEGYEDFIQTDASINPGNSGGALVDLRGHLIGINTAIVGPAGGNVGIGFAIPINMARAIMDQLIRHGKVQRGLLGVQIQNLTPDIALALGIKASRGAVVAKVEPGTAAQKAGIKAGDVIVSVDDKPVSSAMDLRNKVGLLRVGQSIKLGVLRGKTKLSINAVLTPMLQAQAQAQSQSLDPRLAGAVFGEIPQDSPLHGRVTGVDVLQIKAGSPAWNAGLRKGDIITSVNRKDVNTPQQLADAAKANKDVLLLNVRRGDAALFIVIR